jgi:NAD(P)H-dependent flavin oxidoreductase YrpB (nitropropane dioxygenase family)
MLINKMPSLKIGDLIAKIPIIQGGMGVGISLSGLASAVANEGGIGVIAAAGIGMLENDSDTNFREAEKRAFRNEIRKCRSKTDGIIGVNIMVALSDFEELVKIAIEEGVDIIFSGAGLPLNLPKFLSKGSKTKLAPIVSSVKSAKVLIRYWKKKYNYLPDLIVVEGPKAGGHLGYSPEQLNDPNFALDKTVKDLINELKAMDLSIPIVAAGGIYTGKDIYEYIKMGAKGVQMATRFVATHECDASIEFKQAFVNAKKEDLTIIKSPVGLPGRAIKNKFLRDVEKGEKKPFKCGWRCLRTCDFRKAPYCIAAALTNAKKGFLDKGFAFAGSNVYRVDKIVSVKELIKSLIREYNDACEGLSLV